MFIDPLIWYNIFDEINNQGIHKYIDKQEGNKRIQVNFDFDGTLCDPIKAYEKAMEDVLNIKVDLSNVTSSGEIKREILKIGAKEITKGNLNLMKKIVFESKKIKSEINEKILFKYKDDIIFDKKIENVFCELKEENYDINIVSNNDTSIIYTVDWPGNEFVNKILTPPSIKEKPSGSCIKYVKNSDPNQNFIIGDSWKDMKAGLNAGLPSENLIGFNKYNKNGKLEKYTKNIFEDLEKVKEYIFENSKI